MSTPQDGHAEEPTEIVVYRPFEPRYISAQHDRPIITVSLDGWRLLWTLDNPSLKNAIWVTDASQSPDSQQPYYDSTTESWHEVSKSSMFEPKVLSITVRVDDFELWEDNWCEYHRHSEHPESSIDGARWGTIPDIAHVDEYGDGLHLLECCGTQRPLGKAVSVLVKASSSEHGFVTVHDYVSTIHPWLMSLHEEIRAAHPMVLLIDDDPLAPGTELLVNFWEPDLLRIELKQDKNTIQGEGFKVQLIPIA
ncbi:hypothetical protein ACEPPN_010650 [Leptodophora sp. 'Broadleaf-Isolate-01']